MQSHLLEYEEFCPSCGKFATLDDVTGWCFPCSGRASPQYCERCGKETEGKLCDSCKYMRWLERNADKIEAVMVSLQVSAGKAKKIVRSENRPICLCCGNPIKGGQSGKNYFCRKTKACRKGHNSYHYYRTRGFSDALQRGMVAAQKERLIHAATAKLFQVG